MNGITALLFIVGTSAKNLVRRQLARARQPRYLLGMGAGLLYLWSIFARHSARPPSGFTVRVGSTLAAAGMLTLFLGVVLWTWAFGGDEASLSFSQAEIQFLFPAPLSRTTLVSYKLARTLFFSAFTAAFLTLGLGHRLGASPVRFFVGAWLAVATLGLHNVAASLTRASLLQHGARGPVRRGLALLIPLALVGSVAWALWATPLPARFAELPGWFEGLTGRGPLHWTSLPFRPAIALALALPGERLEVSLLAALGSLGVHLLWALSTDADFQEASLALAERRSRRMEQRRRGQLPLRAARAPFRLAPRGPPVTAILWKNLTAAVRLLSLRMAFAFGLVALALGVSVLLAGSEERRVMGAAALIFLAGYFTLFGSQIYRIDFRLDLTNMDLLRTLPLRGWELAAGEVAAPALVMAAAQWLCLAGAAAIGPAEVLGSFGRVMPTVALALVLPPINLCLVIVQNAGVLLFPGWAVAGVQGPRGIEAMGQRLVTLAGTLVVATVALLPACVLGAGVAAGLGVLTDSAPLGLLAGAAASGLALLVEAGFGVLFLGRCFERFDVAQG